jgi:FKBP-type peptidyl-prolyl cis-trans isomerase FklB
MKRNVLILIIAVSTLFACAPKATLLKLNTTEDSLSYSIGMSIGQSLQAQKLTGLNPNIIAQSMDMVLKGDSSLFSKEVAETFIRDYFSKKQGIVADENLKKANNFMVENKKNPGVIELPSGLQYIVISEGTGSIPNDSNMVKTHYSGTLMDGKVFDSSYERGEPAEFPVNGVIQGWTEALKLMKTGSKWKLFIPPSLAYGEQGAGGVIGPNEVLIFELELLEIVQGETNSEGE